MINLENVLVIMRFLKRKGMNMIAIMGILGNLQIESGMNPNNLQYQYEQKLKFTDESYTIAVDDRSYTNFVNDYAGYGLAQWTAPCRKRALLKFAEDNKVSISDMSLQLEFLYSELVGDYKYTVYNPLQKAQSIKEASNIFMLKYEVPYDQSYSAQKYRSELSSQIYSEIIDIESDDEYKEISESRIFENEDYIGPFIASRELYLREEPYILSNRLDMLNMGDMFFCYGEYRIIDNVKWLYGYYGNNKGYIPLTYLEELE